MLSTDMDDWSLLRQYVERRSEAAFETLMRRHLDMVYSAAWRQTGDASLAEEVAQAAFVLLARKAPHLRRGVMVAGWLYRTACLTARRALRDQTRRRIKEREAAEMKLSDSNDEVWTRLKPHLDAALADLGEADRTAIVLRFLEQRDFRDVAAALSISEDAAKKRVTRALEKLRLVFTRQGVTLGLSAIAAVLSARALEAAPAGLLRSSVQAALSGGVAAGPGVGALVAGVVREALIARLKWGVALAGVGCFLAMITTLNWVNPSSHRTADVISTVPEDGSGAGPTMAARPLQPPAPSAGVAEGRTMILRVVADESDQPLADVTVHAGIIRNRQKTGLSTFVTDRGGAAQIVLPTDAIDAMIYWVCAPGRVPTTIAWNRKASMASLGPEDKLRLPQGRLVAGTVVDETGEPVAGATVHFQGEGMPWDNRAFADYEGPVFLSQSERPPPPMTDANGRWSADFISPRAKSVFGYLEHPEFATTQFGHIHPPDPIEPSTNLVLVLERGAAVAGVVRDTAGMPIQDASVNFRDELGRPPRWMKTDAAGRFEFPRVGQGGVFLNVGAKGFEPSRESAVQGGQATNLDIVLKAVAVAGNSVIRGRVTSEDGKSIGVVEVYLAPGQPGLEDIHWGGDTDAEGRFAWTSAPNHPVKLVFRGPVRDWEEQQVVLAPDGTEAVITLKPIAKLLLRGTVSDKSNGKLLPEFKVLWAPGIERGYVANTLVLTEGRNGKFAVDLTPENVRNYGPPGTSTRLDFQAPGYVNKVVLLDSGTNDIDLTIELVPATDIAGTVLRPDGNPAVGAKVFFRGEHFRFRVGEDCFVSMPTQGYPFAVETRAGADGAFRIPKIDGIERLEVVHPEGWASVPLDGVATAGIRLQPWGRLNGVVRSGQGVLPGVEVRATEARNTPEQMLFEFTVKTDAEGRFEFAQLPGGRALVFVPPPQDAPGTNSAAQEIQVEPRHTANLTLSVPAQ
jgi:RNA polymerase sigma factor (sigma-70 family)